MVKTVTRLVSAVSITAKATLPRPTKVMAFEVVPAGQSETMNRPERHFRRQPEQEADGKAEHGQDEQMGGEAGADQHRAAHDHREIAQRQGQAEAEHDQHQADRHQCAC